MHEHASAVLAAIRGQMWAILPEYLAAIEALALRGLDTDVLRLLAEDGHKDRLALSLEAVAAVGAPLQGARMSTIRDGTAVVPVLGPIFPRANMVNSSAGGTSLDAIMRDFRTAEASTDVDRIVMLYDTPGGVVSGVGEAAAAIRGSAKPVTAFVTGNAASLGYWLASQAGDIVAEPASALGSIGVAASVSRQEQPGTDGRMTYEFASSGAPLKRPDVTSDEGKAEFQTMLDAMEQTFIADIAAGRKVSAAQVRADFGRGGMLPAAKAVEVGMADRIGTLESLLGGNTRRAGRSSTGTRRAVAEVEMRRRAAI